MRAVEQILELARWAPRGQHAALALRDTVRIARSSFMTMSPEPTADLEILRLIKKINRHSPHSSSPPTIGG